MKAIIEFQLPEDNWEFETASNAAKYRIAISEILELIRKKLKYSELSNEEYGLLESIRTEILNDIISDLPIE